MLRRLVAVLAACLALVAVQSAWAVPMFCRAEAEARVCHCHHEAGSLQKDDCCERGERDAVGAPGIVLPLPSFVAQKLAGYTPPPAARPAPEVPVAEAAYVASAPARGPPGTPRFLRLRTLVI